MPRPERPLGVALVAGWFAVAGALLATMGFRFNRAIEFINSEFGIWLLTISTVVALLLALAALAIALGLWKGLPLARRVACFFLIAAIVIALAKLGSFVRTVPAANAESGLIDRAITQLWPLVVNGLALTLLLRDRAKSYFDTVRSKRA